MYSDINTNYKSKLDQKGIRRTKQADIVIDTGNIEILNVVANSLIDSGYDVDEEIIKITDDREMLKFNVFIK